MRICFNGLSDNDFENIGQYLPQLESLVIKTTEVLSDKTLEYISELKRLKSLEIIFHLNFYSLIRVLNNFWITVRTLEDLY